MPSNALCQVLTFRYAAFRAKPGCAAKACLPDAACSNPDQTVRFRLTWLIHPAHPAGRHLLFRQALEFTGYTYEACRPFIRFIIPPCFMLSPDAAGGAKACLPYAPA
jgi:hypothetical protein